jgi:hypothetical protein
VVFYDPMQGHLVIRSNSDQRTWRWEIVDMSGRPIAQGQATPGKTHIDPGPLASSLYTLILTEGGTLPLTPLCENK